MRKSLRFDIAALLLLTITSVLPLRAQNVTVYATGLDGPRGLKFGPDGALYVAEAGRGGPNGPFRLRTDAATHRTIPWWPERADFKDRWARTNNHRR